MSLLMQALKNAEHAKRKQTTLAESADPVESVDSNIATEKLALSPLRPVDEEIALAPQELAQPVIESGSGTLEAARNVPTLDMLDLELSPSPSISQNVAAAEIEVPSPAQETPSNSPHDKAQLTQEHVSAVPERPFASAARSPSSTLADTQADSDSRPAAYRPLLQQMQAEAEQPKRKAQIEQQSSLAQQRAKAVFASKKPPANRRVILLAAIGVSALTVLAGAGYYYVQTMSQHAGIAAPMPPQATPSPTPSTSTPANDVAAIAATNPAAPAPTDSPVGLVAASSAVPESGRVSSTTPELGSLENRPLPAAAPSAATETRSKPSSEPQQAYTSIATEAKGIQVHRTIADNQINPALSQAYQLFTSGDVAAARQHYQKVLRQDPNNRDALLGLAAIALQQKDPAQAGAFYVKLLELDPTDPDAIAGLSSLQSGDLSQNESNLKKILAQNPQAGAVLFALGNLYAKQSRWSEAQQAYFRAYSTASTNADYAFNLAVSLDMLNQVKLALDFYQRAVALRQGGPGNFNAAAVQTRIRELKSGE